MPSSHGMRGLLYCFVEFTSDDRMYTELVNDALTEYSYDASLAGLGYDFGSYDRGVFLAASGYNEKVRF